VKDTTKSVWIAVGLFAMAFGLRVPFRGQLPYHWDSAQFALAVSDYNIVLGQPHAPGYFLYVMLGRLVNLVVGDPHASLVWISVVAGSALVSVLYWLGCALVDRRTGVIAALLVMTSPQTWFHSEVALTYIVDALFVSLTVLICWRAMQRGGTWGDAVVIGAFLAVVGGVRQQSAPALLPVVLYTMWRFERDRLAKLAVVAAVALALGLAWFVPMVTMTGGLNAYLEIVRRHIAFNAPATLAGGGLDALAWNIFFVGLYCANGLMLAAVVLTVVVVRRAWRMDRRPFQLLIVWVGSMFLMATVVGFTKQPGYVLNFLPGLLLLTAMILGRMPWPVTVLICAVNVAAFVAWPPAWDRVFFGTARTAREICERDRQLRVTAAAIRSQRAPGDTVICHACEFLQFGLRQFQFVLPEFDQYQLQIDPTMLTPPGSPMVAVRDGKLRFVSGLDWDGKRRVLLIIPPGLSLKIFEHYRDVREAQPLPGAQGMVYKLPVSP